MDCTVNGKDEVSEEQQQEARRRPAGVTFFCCFVVCPTLESVILASWIRSGRRTFLLSHNSKDSSWFSSNWNAKSFEASVEVSISMRLKKCNGGEFQRELSCETFQQRWS